MAILGMGLGPLQSLYSVAIQNAVPMNRIGVVTSANQFFRQIGSTVGVAIFGTLLTNNLNTKLAAWAASKGLPPHRTCQSFAACPSMRRFTPAS